LSSATAEVKEDEEEGVSSIKLAKPPGGRASSGYVTGPQRNAPPEDTLRFIIADKIAGK